MKPADKIITIDDVMAFDPCYDREKMLRLANGKKQLTVREILGLRFVPAEDKFWLVLREEVLPERLLHEFGLWCAEQVLLNERAEGREPHPASWNVLEVKRLWLDGKATHEELWAAGAAVRVAAEAAARAAAWAAWAAWAAEAAGKSQLQKLKEMVEQ